MSSQKIEENRVNGSSEGLNGSAPGLAIGFNERCFCASLKPDASTERRQSSKMDDLLSLVGESSVSWVDCFLDDFEKDPFEMGEKFGFSNSLLKSLVSNQRSGYEDYGNEMGVLLPAILAKGFDVKLNPVLILIRENLVLSLHTTEVKRFFRLRRYAETLMKKFPKKMPRQDILTSILIRVIDENNNRNFEHLLEIEEQGDKLSEFLADSSTPRATLGKKIHEMKHALVVYLGGQWASVDAINSLRYGDADLLTDEPRLLEKITLLATEVHSHIGLAEHLSEVLASGLEVVQTIYNNQLQTFNNRLALLVGYLTIIGTALLVPNTIATALSSPVFDLSPKDESWYLALLFGSTIVSTIAAFVFVKRMGLLPAHPD